MLTLWTCVTGCTLCASGERNERNGSLAIVSIFSLCICRWFSGWRIECTSSYNSFVTRSFASCKAAAGTAHTQAEGGGDERRAAAFEQPVTRVWETTERMADVRVLLSSKESDLLFSLASKRASDSWTLGRWLPSRLWQLLLIKHSCPFFLLIAV